MTINHTHTQVNRIGQAALSHLSFCQHLALFILEEDVPPATIGGKSDPCSLDHNFFFCAHVYIQLHGQQDQSLLFMPYLIIHHFDHTHYPEHLSHCYNSH